MLGVQFVPIIGRRTRQVMALTVLVRAYEAAGYTLIELPLVSIADRAQFILDVALQLN